jgi:hypothetical protein
MFKNLFSKKPAALVGMVADSSRMDITDEKAHRITVADRKGFILALADRNSYNGLDEMERHDRTHNYRIFAQYTFGTRTISKVYVLPAHNRRSTDKLNRVNASIAAALAS